MAADPQLEIDTASKITVLHDLHRQLPQAPEAEKGTLCSFLLQPRYTGDLCAERGIGSGHFHHPSNAMIFDVLMEFYRENEPIDFVSLTAYMRDNGTLNQVGGAHAITELFTYLPTAANAGYYVDLLADKHILREIIRTGTTAAARSYDEQDQIADILASMEGGLLKILKLREGIRTHSRNMAELVKLALDTFESELANAGNYGMPSGIPILDSYTEGFQAPETTVIMGRPSDGKTALALNIAENIAVNRGKRVGIISLEMSDIQLVKRMIFSMARVNPRKIKRAGEISAEEHLAITQAAARLAQAPIFIRDDGGLTVGEIAATASAWKAKHGLDILIVDHAQLAKSGANTNGKTEEVELVSNAMKPIAKRLEIPLVLLSQVTKDQHGNYNAKNSRAIEADADNIWVIAHQKDEDGKISSSSITLSKQRDRERDVVVYLDWNPELQRFSQKQKDAPEQPDLVSMPPSKRRK